MKKKYMKPTACVVVLQQQYHILAGSPIVTSLSGSPENINWDDDGLVDSDELR